jgi:hypothetical protein
VQRFFSASGRAFCLYVVVEGAAVPGERLLALSRFLRTLQISPLD